MGIRTASKIRIVRDRVEKALRSDTMEKLPSPRDLPFAAKLAEEKLWKYLRPGDFPVFEPEPGRIAFEGNDVALVWYGPAWPLVFINQQYFPGASQLFPEDLSMSDDGAELERLVELLGARSIQSVEVNSDEEDELIPSEDYDLRDAYRFALDGNHIVLRISPDGKKLLSLEITDGEKMPCDPNKAVAGGTAFESLCCFWDTTDYQILYRDGKQIGLFSGESNVGGGDVSPRLRDFLRAIGAKIKGSYMAELDGDEGRLEVLEQLLFGDEKDRSIGEVVAMVPKLTSELKKKLVWTED
jgi:hypothetical protein